MSDAIQDVDQDAVQDVDQDVDEVLASSTAGASAPDTVYNRIAMLRVERGITRRQLADALGVHYQTVGYLERGEYAPSLHLALRIARLFEVPVEFVFSLDAFPRIGPG